MENPRLNNTHCKKSLDVTPEKTIVFGNFTASAGASAAYFYTMGGEKYSAPHHPT